MSAFTPPTLDEIVSEMRALGDVLMPYNFPQAPFDPEDPIGILKSRSVVVDGFMLYLHYQKSDYNLYTIESLQIQSRTAPFLPFGVVKKIGVSFLGSSNLTLIEFIRDYKKIYVWSVCRGKDGDSVVVPNSESVLCEYDGLKFCRLKPDEQPE